MPVPVIMLTQEEYDGIMQRLAALESVMPGRSTEVETLTLRVQGVESTLSAYQKTMSDVTKLPVK